MKHQKVTSSNIKSIGYDPQSQRMEVVFNSGHKGHYSNVPGETHMAMMAAESKGKYLHQFIKSKPKEFPWTPHPTKEQKSANRAGN